MRIKTLEYVHMLLKRSEAQARRILQLTRDQQHYYERIIADKEEGDISSDEMEDLKEKYEKARADADCDSQRWAEASKALKDFEANEWL